MVAVGCWAARLGKKSRKQKHTERREQPQAVPLPYVWGVWVHCGWAHSGSTRRQPGSDQPSNRPTAAPGLPAFIQKLCMSVHLVSAPPTVNTPCLMEPGCSRRSTSSMLSTSSCKAGAAGAPWATRTQPSAANHLGCGRPVACCAISAARVKKAATMTLHPRLSLRKYEVGDTKPARRRSRQAAASALENLPACLLHARAAAAGAARRAAAARAGCA